MKRTALIVAWLVSVAAAFLAGRRSVEPRCEFIVETRTDTVRVVQPELMVIDRRGSRTERLPVVGGGVEADSVEVEVPVEQAVYEGEGYKAFVSGYRPMLDSLVFERNISVAVPRKQHAPTRRWSVGLQAGYGITPRGFQPYLGIGMTFRLF